MQWAARSAPHQRSRPRAAPEHELRADRVRRGGEQAALVDREEPGKGAERAGDAGRRGRGDGGAQAVDDRVGGGERDACGGVGLLLRRHDASVASPPGAPVWKDARDDTRRRPARGSTRYLERLALERRPGPRSRRCSPTTRELPLRPVPRAARRQRGDRGRLAATAPTPPGSMGGRVPALSRSTATVGVAVGETRYDGTGDRVRECTFLLRVVQRRDGAAASSFIRVVSCATAPGARRPEPTASKRSFAAAPRRAPASGTRA